MQINNLYRISDYEWTIPKQGDMKVDVHLVASQPLIEKMDDNVYRQIVNVAGLPGVVDKVIVLPDAHPGFGFPVGGVAAFDLSEGVVCFGGVGFDINCGIRLVTTNLIVQDIEKKVDALIREFNKVIPVGIGAKGKLSLSKKELSEMLVQGARWMIENRGMGKDEDLNYIEDAGMADFANPDFISDEAYKREKYQLGTLGSGNHYLEMQIVEEIFDIERARVYGLFKNQVVVTFHTGSRGFGYQVGMDYQQQFVNARNKYNLPIKDKEILAAPIQSEEGKRYIGAVACASNFAFANRQILSYLVNKVFNDVIRDVDTNVMYDIGHNTLKEEIHRIGTTKRNLLVHRKGCTRNFPGKVTEVAKAYRVSGQPVIIGGSMGTNTYVLAGTEDSLMKTYGSTIHGAGREMSRFQAQQTLTYDQVAAEMKAKGIHFKTRDKEGFVEEASTVYKDIEEVIKSITKSNISVRVARLRPIGVLKG